MGRVVEASRGRLLAHWPGRRIFGSGQGFDVATMGDVPQLMRNSFFAAAGSGLLAITLGTPVAGAEGVVEMTIAEPVNGRVVHQGCPGPFRECVVYMPANRQSIAVEPYTCAPTVFEVVAAGIDAGLQVLAPGASIAIQIDITLEATA